ncbi:MAG TPA: hypothetical protein VNZ67_07775 [bacterium]|nr:hypothetical protein [bacterium]
MLFYTALAAALALLAVAKALPADPAPAQDHVVLAYEDHDRDDRPHRPRLLRFEYQGYETRLRVMDRRIDEDERYHRYAAEKAAQHRRDLAAIRARFHYRDEHARHMNRMERDRFDADLRAQEDGLSIVYRP